MPLSRQELTRRALEIAANLDLGYMAASGEYDPDDADRPFGTEAIGRFTVYGQTDGYDDGWVAFADTPDQAAKEIIDMVGDEWGFTALYDLDRHDYAMELPVKVTVTVPGGSHTARL